MVRLTTRVETVRELLEKFLDDDSDMHDMNLTARQQDLLDRQTSLIRNSLMRTSLTGTGLYVWSEQHYENSQNAFSRPYAGLHASCCCSFVEQWNARRQCDHT